MTFSLSSFFPIARAATISMSIPGSSANSTSTPGGYITDFYQFALMIGGVLAFGVIVYGGVRYIASAGNPSGQSDAKEWIEAALLGLLLLVGAYFVLDIVNPQLLNLTLPSIPAVSIQQANTGSGSGSGGTAAAASDCSPACVAPQTCQVTGPSSAFSSVDNINVFGCQ